MALKVPRNAACPCGSGMKYKKCCGTHTEAGEGSAATVGHHAKPCVCAFACRGECAEVCCGGATLITIDEIRNCYDVFPVSIGFRKYTPLDELHRDLLNTLGVRCGGRFIIGDFIAGNRYASRCAALNRDSLCSLHGTEKKPAQCRLVPFSALYPEARQDILFAEQRRTKFARCRGFASPEAGECVVWREGGFEDLAYRRPYYDYQRGALKQAPLMCEILEGMKSQEAYEQFLGGEGILEMPIPAGLLPRVLHMAGFQSEEYPRYIETQWRLCRKESAREDAANPVLGDCAQELQRVRPVSMSGAEHIGAGEGTPGRGGE
ncbi:MAG TPA: SEC-C metal-binding domain-containing protein [Dissulfurispiraceae bacterium]|nr:SEC-C metal-binding domain-containing protein [Dissulfurispiraceae bacterium]